MFQRRGGGVHDRTVENEVVQRRVFPEGDDGVGFIIEGERKR